MPERASNQSPSYRDFSNRERAVLEGMREKMRERVEGIKEQVTETRLTWPLIIALVGGAFTLGGIVYMVTHIEETSERQHNQTISMVTAAQEETANHIATLIESSTANLSIMANAFSDQLRLTTQVFNAELEKRDIKLDIAYKSANQGPRHTLAMANAHKEEDDLRYYGLREQVQDLQHHCETTRARVDAIEKKHEGVGYHLPGSGAG